LQLGTNVECKSQLTKTQKQWAEIDAWLQYKRKLESRKFANQRCHGLQ